MEIHFINHNNILAEDFKPLTEKKIKVLEKYNLFISEIKVEISKIKHPEHKNASHEVKVSCNVDGLYYSATGHDRKDLLAMDKALELLDEQLSNYHKKKSKKR